jgi:hypothetical protein
VAAAAAVADIPSRAGRASWQGERSRGARDPGAELWAATAVAIACVTGGGAI